MTQTHMGMCETRRTPPSKKRKDKEFGFSFTLPSKKNTNRTFYLWISPPGHRQRSCTLAYWSHSTDPQIHGGGFSVFHLLGSIGPDRLLNGFPEGAVGGVGLLGVTWADFSGSFPSKRVRFFHATGVWVDGDATYGPTAPPPILPILW